MAMSVGVVNVLAPEPMSVCAVLVIGYPPVHRYSIAHEGLSINSNNVTDGWLKRLEVLWMNSCLDQ